MMPVFIVSRGEHLVRRSYVVRFILGLLVALSFGILSPGHFFASGSVNAQDASGAGNYASVNGLEMYYEIHGEGEPLVVLHGAYMSIVTMGEIVPRLAETRQVIAVELQGHGRTADIDRPFSYEQMADDVAALLPQIGIDKADFFGFSMGGITSMQIAIRHPEIVDRLILTSAPYNGNGFHPGYFDMAAELTPEDFAGTPYEQDYMTLAPDPEHWTTLVEKMLEFTSVSHEIAPESMQTLTAPTLIIIGDSDSTTPEHAVELFRLRGGGVNGDLTGLPPTAQLAILPATTHLTMLTRVDWLQSMIVEFLDAPPPDA
jgi:pimeloyl-ACP methyl ester carboxylesterase